MASQDDILAQVNGINANIAALVNVMKTRFALGAFTGSFIMPAAATSTITDANAKTTSKIQLQATNAAAGTVMGSAKSLYIQTKNNGSFVVATADGTAPATSTGTFDYVISNTG